MLGEVARGRNSSGEIKRISYPRMHQKAEEKEEKEEREKGEKREKREEREKKKRMR